MPLVERDAPLGAIQQLLARAATGRGGALFVIGQAGLGKTSVLGWAVDAARAVFKVGAGRADVAEAMLPFGVLEQALKPLATGNRPQAAVNAGPDELAPVTRFWSRLRQVRELADRPLLIGLDDLQWADPDSLALIHLLCRRLPELPIALIATTRPWPDPAVHMVESLEAENLAAVRRLAPLTRAAAETVLRANARVGISDVTVGRALDACGGNPLLLVQLAETADLQAESGRWEPANRRVLLARFLGIGEIERRFVRAASVLRPRFHTSIAADIAGLGRHQIVDALQSMFASGLLRTAGEDRAEFAHALIREAVYNEVAPPARIHLHELAFRALVAHAADPAEAAEHALAAHLTGDRAAIAALARAGRDALRTGAVRVARGHLEGAVELAGQSADPALLLDLANALNGDGANEAAVEVAERLLRSASLADRDRADALSLLGRAAFMSGRLERAAVAFEAVTRISKLEPNFIVSSALDLAFWTWTCQGPRAGLPVASRVRELSGAATEPLQACADAAWALSAYGSGDPRGQSVALAAAEGAEVARLTSATAPHWALEPAGVPGDIAVWSERFVDAEHLFTSLLHSAEQRNDPFALFHAAFSWTDGLCRLGRLEEAFLLSERVFEVAEVAPLVEPFAAAARALVLLEQGRLQEAAHWTDQLASLADRHRWFLVVGYDLHRRGTLAWRGGQVEKACAIFGQLEQKVEAWGLRDPSTIPWAADAISSYRACDRAADVERVVERLAPAEALPGLWPRVVALRGRAALAEHVGDADQAEHDYLQAVMLQSAMPLPLARAETLTEFGAFLVRSGNVTRARQVLADAMHLGEEHGARWHAARARAEWRRAGGRARRTAHGALAPQEAAIVGLVRAGRTNRQIARQLFLSENTVETHLAHVYRKLGIRRRWELFARADDGIES
jgi:DNA-binding CsgD family transcriptional regulator/tetratricopeptide (TPR) repeat protein